MNAIQRYANVLSFQDIDADKARFEKLSSGSQASEGDGNIILKKVSSLYCGIVSI